MGRMDKIHFHEIKIVQLLQDQFMGYSDIALFISHLGHPKNAFLIYFPVVYMFSEVIGLKILWAAVFSEWFNTTLKWVLFGQRPYWWVRETSLYNDQNRPDLEQFSITCETGPGSPSGHAMVTAAIWFVLTKAFISHWTLSKEKKNVAVPGYVNILPWCLYGLFMSAICISRLFTASHFPNQVVLGLIIGIIIGHIVYQIPFHKFILLNYLSGSMFLLQAVLYQYLLMLLLQFQPDWSFALATKWCGDPKWIHMNTTPFYALSRDIGALFFMGLAQRYIRSKIEASSRSIGHSILIAILAISLVHLSDKIPLPTEYKFIFYLLGILKAGLVPVTVVGLSVYYEKLFGKDKVV